MSPRGVMANVQVCDTVVSEFDLQSHYYLHFQINTPGKGMESFISPAMGEIVPLMFFFTKIALALNKPRNQTKPNLNLSSYDTVK